jgi:hypothetical protein
VNYGAPPLYFHSPDPLASTPSRSAILASVRNLAVDVATRRSQHRSVMRRTSGSAHAPDRQDRYPARARRCCRSGSRPAGCRPSGWRHNESTSIVIGVAESCRAPSDEQTRDPSPELAVARGPAKSEQRARRGQNLQSPAEHESPSRRPPAQPLCSSLRLYSSRTALSHVGGGAWWLA